MDKAVLVCPICSTEQKIKVPTNKCLAFFKCNGCSKLISSKTECCVVCEFSEQKCPCT